MPSNFEPLLRFLSEPTPRSRMSFPVSHVINPNLDATRQTMSDGSSLGV